MSTTSALIINTRWENMIILKMMGYIYYPVQFQKRGKKVTKILINSSSEAIMIILAYTKELGL